jgi:hypothetical protein
MKTTKYIFLPFSLNQLLYGVFCKWPQWGHLYFKHPLNVFKFLEQSMHLAIRNLEGK